MTFDKKISIYKRTEVKDADGFKTYIETLIMNCWASVKTTKGWTLIANNSDFESATTNFTIRYTDKITRDMTIHYADKVYIIQYLNNVDERRIVLEIQAKEVTK